MNTLSSSLDKLPDLREALCRLLRQVPMGRVTTYGHLAKALGDVVASRWVGEYLRRRHRHDDHCPCHRVVRYDGTLGVHVSGDTDRKAWLLEREGVRVRNRHVALNKYVFCEFASETPLHQLVAWQNELSTSVELTLPGSFPRWIGGIDVSYGSDHFATAAFTRIDITTGELEWQTTGSRRVAFPYISTYLAFRELPVLLDVLALASAQGQSCDVLMVDGSGVLHPRRCGVATMLGVIANIPTIGVTKKRLCGKYDEVTLAADGTSPIVADDECIGSAILPHQGASKPLFVSPGHRIDVATATAVTCQTIAKHRLPEPIYWADRLSREESRRAARRSG